MMEEDEVTIIYLYCDVEVDEEGEGRMLGGGEVIL
jgi:hypothetical protein